MKKLSPPLRNRSLLLVVMLVVVGSTLGLLAPVDVAQSSICAFTPIVHHYYSDATYSVEVGVRGVNCACDDISWGVTSSYVQNQVLCCTVNSC